MYPESSTTWSMSPKKVTESFNKNLKFTLFQNIYNKFLNFSIFPLWTMPEMFEMISTATTTQNFWTKSKRSLTPVTKWWSASWKLWAKSSQLLSKPWPPSKSLTDEKISKTLSRSRSTGAISLFLSHISTILTQKFNTSFHYYRNKFTKHFLLFFVNHHQKYIPTTT